MMYRLGGGRSGADAVALTIEFGAPSNQETPSQRLFELIQSGEDGIEDQVKALVDEGANVNACDSYEKNALFFAAKGGNESVARRLIDLGAEVRPTYKKQPIVAASENGHSGIVKLLLEKGASVNGGFEERNPEPLFLAARNGHLDVINVLVDGGEHYDRAVELHNFGATPLSEAAYKGHDPVVERLIELGARVDLPEREVVSGRRDPIMYQPLPAAAYSGNLRSVQLLVEAGATINPIASDDTGPKRVLPQYPLEHAIRNGSEGVVNYLLDQGADPNLFDSVYTAAINNNFPVLQTLVNSGAKIHNSAVYGAVRVENLEMLTYVMETGDLDISQGTEIITAAKSGNLEIVDYLLSNGANPNAWNVVTPLHDISDPRIIRSLMEAGANPHIGCGEHGGSPMTDAIDRRQPDLVELYFESPLADAQKVWDYARSLRQDEKISAITALAQNKMKL